MRRSLLTTPAIAVLVAALGVSAASFAPLVAGATVTGEGHDNRGPAKFRIAVQPDASAIGAFDDVGFTVTVENTGPQQARSVTVESLLPAAGNLSWALDAQDGINGCALDGPVYEQRLACPAVDLDKGGSFTVHLVSHTTQSTDDVVILTASVAATDKGRATASGTVLHGTMADGCRATPVDTSRTVIFDDEFDEPDVDLTKWTRDELPWPGQSGSRYKHNTQYGSYIIPENTEIIDGVLNLKTNNIPVTEPDVPALGVVPYTEGFMHTRGKWSSLGGYFEMCAKMPQGKGLWPAFWVIPDNGQWPPEMDIMEWFGSVEAIQVGQPMAYGQNAGGKWQGTWIYDAKFTQGFHTFSMWWDPNRNPATIRYYIDGQMVKEVSGTTNDLVSRHPMYMVLNSGTWAPATRGGPPDETTVFPNAMEVDWVRVYSTPPAQAPYSAP